MSSRAIVNRLTCRICTTGDTVDAPSGGAYRCQKWEHTMPEQLKRRRCVTRYNVIEDVCKYMLLISQYRRHVLQTFVSHQVEKRRRTIYVACLTLDDCLSYSTTNRKHMFSESRFRLSYAPSKFLHATDCILELVRIRQSHSTYRSHIFTFTYKGTYGLEVQF
jgi:hypothetical protein